MQCQKGCGVQCSTAWAGEGVAVAGQCQGGPHHVQDRSEPDCHASLAVHNAWYHCLYEVTVIEIALRVQALRLPGRIMHSGFIQSRQPHQMPIVIVLLL